MGPLILTAYWRDHAQAESDSANATTEDTSTGLTRLSPLSLKEVQDIHAHCFMTSAVSETREGDLITRVINAESSAESTSDEPPVLAKLKPEASRAISDWWHKQGGESKTAPLALLRELHEQMGEVSSEALDPRFIPLIWWDPHRSNG